MKIFYEYVNTIFFKCLNPDLELSFKLMSSMTLSYNFIIIWFLMSLNIHINIIMFIYFCY